MSKAEIERLVADHPKVIYMTTGEMFSRYWMYDSGLVARSRAQVYINRLKAPFTVVATKMIDALSKILGGNA